MKQMYYHRGCACLGMVICMSCFISQYHDVEHVGIYQGLAKIIPFLVATQSNSATLALSMDS